MIYGTGRKMRQTRFQIRQEKLQLLGAVTPPGSSQSQLSALFWRKCRTCLESYLATWREEVAGFRLWVISFISSTSTPEVTLSGLRRNVRGKSDHQEPGDPGCQTRHRPRLCSHAPGLLHDSGRDCVQHDSRR